MMTNNKIKRKVAKKCSYNAKICNITAFLFEQTMEDNMEIKNIKARQIFDSRGNPTVEVDVWLENGAMGRASVPSGASTGAYEAVELRDGDKTLYGGKSVFKAVDNVNGEIKNALIGFDATQQQALDRVLIDLDGTPNKARLGANAILGVSLATAKAVCASENIPLYRLVGNGTKLPVPMMNILNGGKHADNSVNIQEFMIVPHGAKDFCESMRFGTDIYRNLKAILKEKNLSCGVGDEGGFAPNLSCDEEALQLLCEAIERSNLEAGKDVSIALDVASSEMFNEGKKVGKNGCYYFWKTGKIFGIDELVAYYEKLVNAYPLISIEDGVDEDDFEGWEILTNTLGKKIQLVGDDLFVTNAKRLEKGIEMGIANSILIKPNQIGTLTETIETINLAKSAGYSTVISHRSGETEDTTIADLAVGLDLGQIKTGAPCRSERVAKYNQLLRIEEELKND